MTTDEKALKNAQVSVRQSLVETLRLDLIGPGEVCGFDTSSVGSANEILPQRPSTWYLTGFLVPAEASVEQKLDEQSSEELDCAGLSEELDESSPEPAASIPKYLPSSIGITVLIDSSVNELSVTARWGDYESRPYNESVKKSENLWFREPKEEVVKIELSNPKGESREIPIPNSLGLVIFYTLRPVNDSEDNQLPDGTKCISVFMVNKRKPLPDEIRDQAFAFQCQIEIENSSGFLPRPALHDLDSNDPDQRIADLQYRDAYEFSVGHGISTSAMVTSNGECKKVKSTWIPEANVERVAPVEFDQFELSMDFLSEMKDTDQIERALGKLPKVYRSWIEQQRKVLTSEQQRRQEAALDLLDRAEVAANRIENGKKLLKDPLVLEAFRISNKAMASAARQRLGVMVNKTPADVKPMWRPFQLAFILMNLAGIVDPNHHDREVVDLLFFPTGGGKTEAYLGLAAFTLVYRRLKNPGISSAGLTVLMRYTLRLLTLDQLSRASTLICALELEREKDVEKLGKWPFEIGLWVGKAATPNQMGRKGDSRSDTARAKTIAFKNDDRKPSPIPLENCPWCGTKFKSASFQLLPNPDSPTDLRVLCVNRRCEFTRERNLPILSVDEPIYRRLPCFLIATVDKFAAMPWTGEVGQFFGYVSSYDKNGFYGPCSQQSNQKIPGQQLLPPELIIQDELHLISGPLGTIVGLYEVALDELASRKSNGKKMYRPKIVASTATVRRAEHQIRALFNRREVDIFPPPGPDRRDSFFAEVHSTERSNPRLYIGVAAQGRSPKVVMLRCYLALMATAQKIYLNQPNKNDPNNLADPYMTLLGYFNSLRELGGARRVIEDEVGNRLSAYGNRIRVNEKQSPFSDRKIAYEVVELTSRVSTDKVADAKRRLSLPFSDSDHVDAAIATNMISVGLDITRLGLMVVYGQPFTTAEYIQCTSRVGRDHNKPGLVVTILNIHKPRDRSYYERFTAYHETFYRSVEVTSVTPFSPRALDRALAGSLISLARLGISTMTPPLGASEILSQRQQIEDMVVPAITERAFSHDKNMSQNDAEDLKARVRDRCLDLLDEWAKIALDFRQSGVNLQYQTEAGAAQRLLYEFLNPEIKNLPNRHKKFRANRSMRDVEPSVNIWVKTIEGVEVEEAAE